MPYKSFGMNKSSNDGSTVGCLNCYKSCKPCSMKCKCKMRCNNPLNNGGKCKKCDTVAVEESEDDSEQSDNEQSDDIVPVISSTNDRNINIDTDSDDMESEIDDKN